VLRHKYAYAHFFLFGRLYHVRYIVQVLDMELLGTLAFAVWPPVQHGFKQ